MNEHPERVDGRIGEDAFDALHGHDLMALFDELSFRQKWKQVFAGLKEPKESGSEQERAALDSLPLANSLLVIRLPRHTA